MSNNELSCALCGGTDFTKEAGYYYCNECQTQSQEVQEHAFEREVEDVQPVRGVDKRSRTKRIKKIKKVEDQLTSWECYNYIIHGLVKELIEIGAKSTLKQIVKHLWLKYLCKLEVLSNKSDATPKLGACNSKIDAEIIYGKLTKRKKARSRTPSPSASDDASSLHRQRIKNRRSLILAEYDQLSSQVKTDESSLLNQTLTSLGAPSEASSENARKVLFNKSAEKECLKSMTKNHFKEHCGDLSSLLGCHPLTYRRLSDKYTKGPEVLTRKKIYALLYIGLLINKDKIQLGDMLRYIREGYLSYLNVNHFFPEENENKNLNMKFWNSRSSLLNHKGIRVVAAQIAKYLEVVDCIPRQNVVELCQRYCKELNLPDEVWGYTINLMSRIPPKMHFTKSSSEIPNYEGRALSMILFTVKLIFGLDNCTEEYFSTFAQDVNSNNLKKMFVWKDWAHYIIYRKLVLMQHHFPSQHAYNNLNNKHCNEFITFLTEQNLKYNEDTKNTNSVAEVLTGLLEKLSEKQSEYKNELIFKPSLTPFRSYAEVLFDSCVPDTNNYLIDVLGSTFQKHSLEFLNNPYFYIHQLHSSKRIGVKHRGVNKNIKWVTITNTKRERANWRSKCKRKHNVQLVNKEVDVPKSYNEQIGNEFDVKAILNQFEIHNMPAYKKSLANTAIKFNKDKQILKQEKEKLQNQAVVNGVHSGVNAFNPSRTIHDSTPHSHYIHYNPYERFWLRSRDVSEINKDDFMDFFDKFPESFKVIFNECARISEQDLKEYFEEYNNVEIYLCYVSSFAKVDKFQNNIVGMELSNLITRATKKW